MKRWGEVAQSCPTLCNPIEGSPPGSSIHGIFQARILEWVAISFSRGYSRPGIKLGSPALQADSLPAEPIGNPWKLGKEYDKAVYLHLAFSIYIAECIIWNASVDVSQAGIKIANWNIDNFRYTDDTTVIEEHEEELKRLLMKVKDESEETGMKLNIQ